MNRSVITCFFVPGIPQPGGSKKGFVHPSTGRVVIVDDAKHGGEWRSVVALSGRTAYRSEPVTYPISLAVTFVVPRPNGHFGTGRNAGRVKGSAPAYPAKKPDLTKLLRSTEDALTGIIWADDALIVHQDIRKTYGTKPGAHILVRTME